MKKIFTLVFSMGLLTAAFAQDGHHRDNNRNNVIVNPSYGYQSGKNDRGANKSYGTTTPFMNSKVWDSQLTRDHDSRGNEDFRFNNDRRGWASGNRHDDTRSYRDMHKKHSPKYHNPRTGFQISFEFGR